MPANVNRKIDGAQAGGDINSRPGNYIGHLAFRSTGLIDMTGGDQGQDRPTFAYTFPYTFATL